MAAAVDVPVVVAGRARVQRQRPVGHVARRERAAVEEQLSELGGRRASRRAHGQGREHARPRGGRLDERQRVAESIGRDPPAPGERRDRGGRAPDAERLPGAQVARRGRHEEDVVGARAHEGQRARPGVAGRGGELDDRLRRAFAQVREGAPPRPRVIEDRPRSTRGHRRQAEHAAVEALNGAVRARQRPVLVREQEKLARGTRDDQIEDGRLGGDGLDRGREAPVAGDGVHGHAPIDEAAHEQERAATPRRGVRGHDAHRARR